MGIDVQNKDGKTYTSHLLPRHVGIIMDGNGRWAVRRGKPRNYGHRAGMENIRRIVRACVQEGIQFLTIFAFSTENWNRPKREVDDLIQIIDIGMNRELDGLHDAGVRVNHIGSLDGLPQPTRTRVQYAVRRTQENDRLVLNLAFNYGGRADITQAVRNLVDQGVSSSEITENCLDAYLSTAGQPDPDLIIRTGGEMRLSNFLLWQAAYTEFYSTDVTWPDFDEEEFHEALRSYQCRQRRFGKLENPGLEQPRIPYKSESEPHS